MSHDERVVRWLSDISRHLLDPNREDETETREHARQHFPQALAASWEELGVSVEEVLQLMDRSGLLRWLGAETTASNECLSMVAAEFEDRIRQRETTRFALVVLNLARGRTIEAAAYGDWEVWLPDAGELAELAPIPQVAHHARSHVWPFDPDLHTDVVLLRSRPRLKPMPKGLSITFDLRQAPWIEAWQPLLMFNLFVAETAIQATQHGWVSAGFGAELRGSLPTEPATHDGETYYERALTAPWPEDDGPGGSYSDFARLLNNKVNQLHGRVRDVLERASRRFLTASAACVWDGSSPPDVVGQLVADYVSVLETLTIAEDDDRSYLAHKTAQHVAVLCADDRDDARLDIFRQVKRAYAARSRYAHGGEVTEPLDVVELRSLVQRTLIRFIVVAAGDGSSPVALELPKAVLSHSYRRELIDMPVAAFAVDLHSPV